MRVSDHPAAQAGPEHRTPRAEKPRTPPIVAYRMAYLEAEIDLLQGTLQTVASRIKAGQTALHEGDAQAREANAALTARRVAATERYNALLVLRNQCAAWLQVAGTLEDARPKIKVPTNPTDFAEAITELRLSIRRLKEQLAQVTAAPVKPANLKSQVRQMVHNLAAKGRPPTAQIKSDGSVNVDFTTAGYSAPPFAYLAWLMPDQMVERIVADITERQAHLGRTAMTADERRDKIAELKAALDKAERRDVFLTGKWIDEGGTNFVFRADTEVSAFLGVRALRNPVSNRAIQEASR